MDLWTIEREMRTLGYESICGVDEAGRGPLAGPVYAAAVILPFGITIPNLNDSKKLSKKKREALFQEITTVALAYGIAYSDHIEIDEMNILNATYLAMNRAIDMLSYKPDIALIDGNRNQGITCNNRLVVGGDAISASIAAASILSKVSRDAMMVDMAKTYPHYGFEMHKGYGTKLHFDRLREHGISDIHRKTFLRKFSKEKNELHRSREDG